MEIYEVKVDSNGDKYWYQNDKLHRLDGPALELSNGDKKWYQNGKLHRLDGPASEYSIGDKYWYQNGKLHRLDGPAIEWADGDKFWYVKNKGYSEQEFNVEIQKLQGIITVDGVKYKKI